MLRKLIGTEFQATRRIFLPAYGVLLILTLLNAVGMIITERTSVFDVPSGILLTTYVFAMFAVCVLSFAYMINRFYKNLLGDEGYLMFTLPVRPSQLIWSKAIVSTLWMILTAIVCMISVFLLIMPLVIIDVDFSIAWSQLMNGLSILMQQFGINLVTIPVELIILCIIYVLNFCMHIYACLSIGGLANRHRLGWSFVAYLAFGIVTQIIMTIGMMICDKLPLPNIVNMMSSNTQMHFVLISASAFFVICTIINFVITNYILSKRLNLQ